MRNAILVSVMREFGNTFVSKNKFHMEMLKNSNVFHKRYFSLFRSFCRKNGIQMIAYSPFGSPDLPWGEKLPHILIDPVLKRIAAKHKRSTANVALRWLLQRGLATIPKVCRYSFL